MSYAGLGQALRVAAGSTSLVNDRLGLEQTSSSANGTSSFTRTPEGTIVGEKTGGTDYYFLFDGLGSVVSVVDGSGSATPVTTYTYTPYGKPSCTSGTCSLYEPIRFAGGYQDSQDRNERLVKFGERYYDFASGRWTQLDSVNQPLDLHGWNNYIYAGDEPINNIDPSGMCISGFGWACDAYDASKSYLENHRWARCALFVAGSATLVAEYGRTAKQLYDAYRGIKKLQRAEILGRVGRNAGLVGSGGVIISALTGGCIGGLP